MRAITVQTEAMVVEPSDVDETLMRRLPDESKFRIMRTIQLELNKQNVGALHESVARQFRLQNEGLLPRRDER